MDLTGSIAEITTPLSMDFGGSLPETGSSAIDTLVGAAFFLPNLILGLIGSFGADLGSTGGIA
ncbi:hypothetical protein ACIQD2_07390 [Dietzia maris]